MTESDESADSTQADEVPRAPIGEGDQRMKSARPTLDMRISRSPLLVFGAMFGGLTLFFLVVWAKRPETNAWQVALFFSAATIWSLWWFAAHRVYLTEKELIYLRPLRKAEVMPRDEIESCHTESGVRITGKGSLPFLRLVVRRRGSKEEVDMAINIKLFTREDVEALTTMINTDPQASPIEEDQG